jgi:Fur family ferric uptake transcriptional regulator
MNINEIKRSLKPHRLKLTLTRLKVLEIFLSNTTALTYPELLRLTNDVFDRVSVYRTLKAFEDAGIIHRIIGAASSPSYALSHLGKREKEPNHPQHLHFSCIKCNCVYCLDDQLVPSVTLPDMYEVHSLSMIVVGICRNCTGKQDLTL